MANRNSGHRAGGGIKSNKVIHKPQMKSEPRAQGYRPPAVSQIGQSLGNHVTERTGKVRGAIEPAKTGGYNPPSGVNLNAKPTVYGCGTQHGLTAPRELPPGRPVVLERGRS